MRLQLYKVFLSVLIKLSAAVVCDVTLEDGNCDVGEVDQVISQQCYSYKSN